MTRAAVSRRPLALVALALVLATVPPYAQVRDHAFLTYDDDKFLVDNPAVQRGLDAEAVAWAFTTNHASLWLPVTWLSHMVDFALFGRDAGAHHLVNLLQHLLNAVLVLVLLARATGRLWPAALVAALFALHPQHVESVVWVTERKDTLSTLFLLLTVGAYGRWATGGGRGPYLLALAFCALGLMAKPMLVTVPVLLLVLDLWPLGRTEAGWRRLLTEKIPFAVLAAATGVVTLLVGRAGGIVAGLEQLPVLPRLTNAVVATATYPVQMLWPLRLRAQVAFRQDLPWGQVALAMAFLLAVTWLAVRWRRSRPWFTAGWAWYLVALVPVSGLLQQGSHALADRYTYVSLLGPFWMIAWAGAAWAGTAPGRRRAAAVAAAAWLAALGGLTWRQAATWRDPVTLFTHAVTLAPDDPLARSYLGGALAAAGRHEEAVAAYEASLAERPGAPEVHLLLARSLAALGRPADAARHFAAAAPAFAHRPEVAFDLGTQLMQAGRPAEAAAAFGRVLAADPDHPGALTNRGLCLLALGRAEEGAALLRRRAALAPDDAVAQYNLACGLSRAGDLEAAAEALARAVALGFTDWAHMDTDPDLAALRATEAYRRLHP